MYKCNNCSWEGEELSIVPLKGKCPVCGDSVSLSTSVPVKNVIQERVKDLTEDLLDDGKRNFSNDPKKKSPGRKRKSRKVRK